MTLDLAIYFFRYNTERINELKKKIDKLEFIKFFFFKRHYFKKRKTIHRMGEIFVNHISDQDLMTRVYEELSQLNNENGQYN